jgi:hypothetical protein
VPLNVLGPGNGTSTRPGINGEKERSHQQEVRAFGDRYERCPRPHTESSLSIVLLTTDVRALGMGRKVNGTDSTEGTARVLS